MCPSSMIPDPFRAGAPPGCPGDGEGTASVPGGRCRAMAMDTATGEDRERYERALREQCAMEKRSILFLKRCLRGLRGQPDMERRFMWHVEESEAQARRLATLLSGRGTKPLPGNAAPSVTGWLGCPGDIEREDAADGKVRCRGRERDADRALLRGPG